LVRNLYKQVFVQQKEELKAQRYRLIIHIEQLLEGPIAFLGFVWLALLIVQMVYGLSSVLEIISTIIWGIFIADFLVRLFIAPRKKQYLKKNWLIAVSLFVPALRFIRILRAVRLLGVVQSSSILTMIGSVNRSMRSLNATLKRRGFIYVIALTIAVILVGAAGMFAFEHGQPRAFHSYPDAVWWTIMLLITIGSEYWPHTAAGKVLSVLISIYGFSVLGYITATLASFFVGRDAERPDGPVAGSNEIAELRSEIQRLAKMIEERNGNGT
jgi:voltage-gated potassium channel